jgi:hypothetical protein
MSHKEEAGGNMREKILSPEGQPWSLYLGAKCCHTSSTSHDGYGVRLCCQYELPVASVMND